MNKINVKNISKSDQTVVGIGVVKAGETVEVEPDFYNANFEHISEPRISRSASEERRIKEGNKDIENKKENKKGDE